MTPHIAYLDNAATTFPKPPSVLAGVRECIQSYCGNPGRGSHPLAMASAEKIFDCRVALASFFGFSDPGSCVFTMNTTYAINLFLKGILHPGDHVLISDLEHNSVFRPIYKLAKAGVISYDVFPSMCGLDNACPVRICAGIAKRIRPNTRLVICTHVSNLCPYALPLGEIGAFCHRHGLLFAVDGAQSAGHLPIHMEQMNIDALAIPAHKGLYGIQGLGVLALANAVPMDTLIEGGNGLLSLEGDMPKLPPERYESGTLPTPAIVGLLGGLKAVSEIGLSHISAHEAALLNATKVRLSHLNGIQIYVPQYSGSTLLFNVREIPSERLAAALGKKGVCVRGGHHCAALGHATLKTPPDGAVRVSFGIFNTVADVDRLFTALTEIL